MPLPTAVPGPEGSAGNVTTLNGHVQTDNSSAPAVAVGAGAGSGATAALVSGTDTAGQVTITTAGTPAAGTLATVTFATPFAAKPACFVCCASADSGLVPLAATSTTTVLTIYAQAGVTTAHTYLINYLAVAAL